MAIESSVKISDTVIEITESIPVPEPIKIQYTRQQIEAQKVEIQRQIDEYVATRQGEIDRCDAILAEMDTQGIIATQPEEI